MAKASRKGPGAGNPRLLERLVRAFGASGSEEDVRAIIYKEIRPYVDDIRIDKIGNLIARRKGSRPKVMLAAHMDEIGLMVKRIEERGAIYCSKLGGIDAMYLIGQQVHLKTGGRAIHGVVTLKEMSAMQAIDHVPTIGEVYVDTGLTKKELLKLGVEIGDYVYLEPNPCCTIVGDFVFGKALDNRIGCYILLEVAKRLAKLRNPNETYFVFTVQEEVGLYGARTSAFQIEPDWALAVDVTHANDVYPEPTRWLGKGPGVTTKDGEFIANPCINGWLKQVAKKHNIPIQLEASESGTTDAATIAISRAGVPSSVLSVPVRNIHTAAGIASMKDIANAILLLEKLLKDPPKACTV